MIYFKVKKMIQGGVPKDQFLQVIKDKDKDKDNNRNIN
jgi:hypothetical protein